MSVGRLDRESQAKRDVYEMFHKPDHWVFQYGTPTPNCTPKSPFHRKQLEVLFEGRYFHWLTDRVVNELIAEGVLKEERRKTAHFVYRSDLRYTKRAIAVREALIRRYSDPAITKGIGDYAELLFGFMFEVCGFKIVGRNTNELGGRKWTESNHDLDFIVRREGEVFGVEIKNTLPYMEKDEFELKLRMCSSLGVTPLWILRNAPDPQFRQMKDSGGSILIFKTQIYPPAQEPLVKSIWENMRLPVSVRKEIPPKVISTFKERFK